jgi:hypothetical protein
MLTVEDYKELSNRFARLAIEVAAPSVAAALMAVAFDYASRATNAPGGCGGIIKLKGSAINRERRYSV